MRDFRFTTNEESDEFCWQIVRRMQELFGISEGEALGRINEAWQGLELISSDDYIYHEDQEYWAKTIYYGKDSFWWLDESNLQARPFTEMVSAK